MELEPEIKTEVRQQVIYFAVYEPAGSDCLKDALADGWIIIYQPVVHISNTSQIIVFVLQKTFKL
jgi:hypothetical protein